MGKEGIQNGKSEALKKRANLPHLKGKVRFTFCLKYMKYMRSARAYERGAAGR